MQSFITRLAAIHAYPLSGPEASASRQGRLIVEMEGSLPLIVELTRANQVEVSYYSEEFQEDLRGEEFNPDKHHPDCLSDFYTGTGAWMLVAVDSPYEYMPMRFAERDAEGVPIFEKDHENAEQAQAAEGADRLAEQWEKEGWLEHGLRR